MSASRNPFANMRRYPGDGWIGGVCAGLAAHFDWNAKVLRITFALGLFFSGFFPVGAAYCLLWYVMEEAPGKAPYQDASEPAAAYASAGPSYSRSTPSPTIADVKARFARLEERLNSMEESVTSNEYELRRELRKLES